MNIIERLWRCIRGEKPTEKQEEEKPKRDAGAYTTHFAPMTRDEITPVAFAHSNAVLSMVDGAEDLATANGLANDSIPSIKESIKALYSFNDVGVPDLLLSWYVRQGFIGYQACAIMAQHWLINKACETPAKDALRNGWKIKADKGLKQENVDSLVGKDDKYRIVDNALQFSKMSRIFGIRIAIFVVESDDPDYYEKPFNIDGVKKGKYRGISQVDPYWCVPELRNSDILDPASQNFYEPEYWIIGGRTYHKSHLCVGIFAEVPDIMKPAYRYGGVSLTQMIYERVYCAERSANEGPQLLMTKRKNVKKVDLESAALNPSGFKGRAEESVFLRDSYGVEFIDLDEDYTQHETSLADVDSVIMTEYQLVASIANMPATRLIEMQPKGFNSAGENEQKNYRQALKSIQTHEMSPLIRGHYIRLAKSDLDITVDDIDLLWNSTDDPTAEQVVDRNLKKMDYYLKAQESGAASADDIADALNNDDESGFSNLKPADDGLVDDDLAFDSEWKEEDHPRDEDGKFASGSTSGSSGDGQDDISGLLGVEYKDVKGSAAVDKLIQEKRGHVKGAFKRSDIGDIDLVWGNDDIGLQHIIKRRQEQGIDVERLLSELPEVIEQGEIRRNDEGNFEIWHKGNMAVVYPEFKNNQITFLVTAYRQRKAPKDLRA